MRHSPPRPSRSNSQIFRRRGVIGASMRLRSGLSYAQHDDVALERLRASLVDLVDDQLMAAHQIDRIEDPDAARKAIGDELYAFVDGASAARRLTQPRSLDHILTLHRTDLTGGIMHELELHEVSQLAGRVLDEVEVAVVGKRAAADARARRRSSPAATCCSRTSQGWARRSPPARSPRHSGSTSAGCSSPPTCFRPTSPARSSTTSARATSRSGAGPIFTDLLLADEINRTPPKTQSALLEAMQERQVTVEGQTFPLADAVPRAGHRQPDRVRGHVSAARGPARPVHAAGRASATRRADEEWDVLQPAHGPAPGGADVAPVTDAADAAGDAGGGRDGHRRRDRRPLLRRAGRRHREHHTC